MSFSGDVKEELSRELSVSKHCQIAELAAILRTCGSITIDSRNRYGIKIHTENVSVARKVFTLFQKTFNIVADVLVRRNMHADSILYIVYVKNHSAAMRILLETRLLGKSSGQYDAVCEIDPELVKRTCCRRAFIRGAFLAAGSMSDPRKAYHFEIVCGAEEMAVLLKELILKFELDAKIVQRTKSYVVYLKEGSQIVDMLNVMEAHRSLMNLENVRILKEISNTVNRRVNCETANLNKTVSASVRQVEDIHLIEQTIGIHALPEGLAEIAELRLEHPDASLKELGEMLTPAVGKSGVNHRLRKIGETAENIRQKSGGIL